MKSKIAKLLLAAGALAVSGSANAQNTYSGYFLDGYTYRYQMNPAMGNESNFFSIPALGNLNVAFRGNLHLNSVIYNLNGKTVLFSNPNLGVSEVMNKFSDKNKIGTNMKINILSGGFKAWGGYNTVSINANANMGISVPKSFFSLVKEGISNKSYDIENLKADVLGYAEIAFGHSRDIKQVEGLRVGANLKFLIGLANIQADFKNANLNLNENSWTGTSNADIYANLGGFQYKTKTNDQGRTYVSGADMNGNGSIGPNGFGLALDLGAEYKYNDLKFSLALLDLGFISFSNTKKASTNGERYFDSSEYIFNVDEDAPNSFDNEWKRMRDGLSDLYQLSDMGDVGGRTRGLAATLNVGVDYTLPVYRNLHFGLLNTTSFNGPFTFTEFRLSANVTPIKVLSADVNLAAGTYGVGFGWLINVHPKGFNLFAGMDHTMGKLCKQGIPLNSNASFNFGINIPF